MIKLSCTDRAKDVMLDFGPAFGDRDAIRDVLNRRLTPSGAASAAASAPNRAVPAPSPSATEFVIDWNGLPTRDREWRQLLMRKKEVFDLHRSLVASRIVEDEKFWKGMNVKYKPNGQRRGATAADLELADGIGSCKGVPSASFIPVDAEATKDMEVKWIGDVPNPGERHRIFMEHPAVSLAYRAKVLDSRAGARMSDTDFWTVYKQSSMAQKHVKGTKRAAVVATQADALFATYHAREDDAAEAAERRRVASMASSINMDRFDDHRQIHVEDAHRAGDAPMAKRVRGNSNVASQRRGLELMRKLNTHGTMVLDGVSFEAGNSWREEKDAESIPALSHLKGAVEPTYTKLALENEQAFLAAQSGKAQVGKSSEAAAEGSLAEEVDTPSAGKEDLANSFEKRAQFLQQALAGLPLTLSSHLEGRTDNCAKLNVLLQWMKP